MQSKSSPREHGVQRKLRLQPLPIPAHAQETLHSNKPPRDNTFVPVTPNHLPDLVSIQAAFSPVLVESKGIWLSGRGHARVHIHTKKRAYES